MKGLDWNPASGKLLSEGVLACGLGALAHGGVCVHSSGWGVQPGERRARSGGSGGGDFLEGGCLDQVKIRKARRSPSSGLWVAAVFHQPPTQTSPRDKFIADLKAGAGEARRKWRQKVMERSPGDCGGLACGGQSPGR